MLPKKYKAVGAEEETREKRRGAEKKRKERQGEKQGKFSVGDVVEVTDGVFCGMSGMVYQVKKERVSIGIQFLGRAVEVEMPLECLRKI